MGDKTKIQWTDASWTDRGGRRTRVYQRQNQSRPGQQMRRQMRARGFSWCRRCRDWLPCSDVAYGACREHRNAEYRERYAENRNGFAERTRRRTVARKRGIAPLPIEAAALLMELFSGRCAYCGRRADTFDHVTPISAGGETVAGNILPACVRCNSRKKAKPLDEWDGFSTLPAFTIEYLLLAENPYA